MKGENEFDIRLILKVREIRFDYDFKEIFDTVDSEIKHLNKRLIGTLQTFKFQIVSIKLK